MEKRRILAVIAAVMLVLLSSYASAVASPFGSPCRRNVDCSTGLCLNGICSSEGPCANFILDNGEADVDCGGVCAEVKGKLCGLGKGCVDGSDCSSGICGSAGKCTNVRASGTGSPLLEKIPGNAEQAGSGFAVKATMLLLFIAAFVAAFAFFAWIRKIKAELRRDAGEIIGSRRKQSPAHLPQAQPPHQPRHHYRHDVFKQLEKTYSQLSGEELFEHLRRKTGRK